MSQFLLLLDIYVIKYIFKNVINSKIKYTMVKQHNQQKENRWFSMASFKY